MQNFTLHPPTKIIFGKGQTAQLHNEQQGLMALGEHQNMTLDISKRIGEMSM
ncbi:hypothetical protein [Xenorhabdus szentirmaii]|uniref:Uncharacterized protein n=2 Tax=Xenorhabdus szentirmaii TaxID=290112 RepID=W1IZT7_9GAMM|nr:MULTISPECIES: hypothetical protein [Xenorhabdus]MBD2779573.1 hypothetical protein [Xenorhabdus sp. 38]MBD2792264.1 hypothetical protein [Xenorhabdus sp. CUL]MBD2801288.1 hypothetical protein [Xenorhabdus sp. M]MBD2803937.1 hypothetical protein [Xenorhabdus sp. ZM]MBD2821007.1 hypothetical protein [Xenorhabdus sp. 42]